MKRIIFVLTLILFYPLGIALTAACAEETMLDEIIVKGKKETLNEESLTMKEVKESPARDIGEALERVEGVNIITKGAIANDVVIRGQQKDNINVFLDGVRLHGACPNRMDPPLFHYDFAEVEEVKIIKGPYDLTNPGGIGGEVEAISKKPGRGIHAEANATYGSFNMGNISSIVSYGTDIYDVLLGYAYKYSQPPRSGDGKRITDIYSPTSVNRYRESAIDSRAYQINTGWTKVGLNPTKNSRTELSYSYQDADHVLYPYLLMDAQYDRTQRLNWQYRIEKTSPRIREIKFQAYWDHVSHLMDDRLRVSSLNKYLPYSMRTDATTEVYGAKAIGAFNVGSGVLTTGFDYYNRGWDATNQMASTSYRETAMIPDVNTDNLGFFAGYELPLLKNLTIKGGLRGDLTWAKAHRPTNKASDSTDYSLLGGNVQLSFTPVQNLEMTLGFGSMARTPDPQELYINSAKQQGNPYLKPTRNNEIDLGARYATDRFFIKASLFSSELDDFIYIYKQAKTRSFTNINAVIWGGELSSQFALPYNLYLKASCSYTEGQNQTDSRPLSEIPPFKGVVALRYDVDTWFLEVMENFAARQNRTDDGLNEMPTGGWATTDIKAGFTYKKLSLYAGVSNVWDKYYFSSLSYQRDPFASGVKVPETGRSFYMSGTYRF